APVKPQIINSVATKSCVRSRKWVISVPWFHERSASGFAVYLGIPGNKFIPGAVDGEEKSRICGVRLKFLPQAQNVIVHRARGRIVLVAPDFAQELVALSTRPGEPAKNFSSLNSC